VIFRFAFPWAFAVAPLAVAAAWVMARRRVRGGARLALPRAATRVKIGTSVWVRVERFLPWMRAIALLLMVVALARPQSGARLETTSTYGVDIVIALDNSTSMSALDFQPDNRLGVAKRTVAEFVDGRPLDRIGLVVFAGIPTTRSPLTLDHAMFLQFLEQVTFAPQEEDGTALGMGLATSVNRLRRSTAQSKVVVLVTDGRNNRGHIAPEAAAEAAGALEVKVYTVGVGTEGLVPVPMDTARGRQIVAQRMDLDEELLREIADRTGGEYFRASDAEALRAVFAEIDTLEKTEIESQERVLYDELFPRFVLPAIGLFLLEGLLAATRLRRVP
jgi:Ca-activated chloride channel family protein